MAIKGNFVILGGTTKSATTSLFQYLAAHPEICASSIKETRFFLEEHYPRTLLPMHYKKGVNQYTAFFNKCAGRKWFLEGTPDYLYSHVTPKLLKENLESVRVVFCLREPVARVKSWYKYAQQIGWLKKNISFSQYVDCQFEKSYSNADLKQHYLAVEQGKYSRHLERFFEILGRENVKVFFQDNVEASPQAVMQEVCEWLDIGYYFYDDFDFRHANVSVRVSSPGLHRKYIDVKRFFSRKVVTHARLHGALRELRKQVDKAVYKALFKPADPTDSFYDESSVRKLSNYYRDDIRALNSLLDGRVPQHWLNEGPGEREPGGDESQKD